MNVMTIINEYNAGNTVSTINTVQIEDSAPANTAPELEPVPVFHASRQSSNENANVCSAARNANKSASLRRSNAAASK